VNLRTPITIGEALDQAHSLINSASDSPALDVQLLLAHVRGKSRTWVVAHHEEQLSADEAKLFETLVSERERGVPLPYLLGWWEFYGRRFNITDAVLIPRPETELLVEAAISFLNKNPDKYSVADIGTGSGCIATSLAAELSNLQILATDVSIDALVLAKENALKHGVLANIRFVQMDLATAVKGPLDVVCANLPYIPTFELERLEVGKWEPSAALDGGVEGLKYIHDLLVDLPRKVRPGSLILLEVESGNGQKVIKLAENCFPNAQIQLQKDMAGKDRLVSVNV
jgi:release factor glutamine methyltransferase